MSLRSYRDGDLEALTEIRRDVDLQHLLMANPDTPPDGDVEGWIRRRESGGCFLVIADGDSAVGFVQVAGIHRKNRHGWLGIALRASAQGRGLGRAAMGELEVHASEALGLRKLMLEVRADNDGAIRMYTDLGYRRVGVYGDHYWDGRRHHDSVVMEKMLEGS